MKMERAYSLLTIKSINEEQRELEGIATTPTPDRMNDVVEPKGAQFKLPLPLLYQHDPHKPIGEVYAAKVTSDGIVIKARIAKGVAPYIEEAWALIKAQLVRGFSIGFRSIEHAMLKDGGIHFLKWDWLELSAVTIPAQADASIQTIKAIDTQQRAASGAYAGAVVRLADHSPGASGSSTTSKGNTMNISEQIAGFEAKRAALVARQSDLMELAGKEGRTLEPSEKEEYDNNDLEVKSIDEHLVRLRKHQMTMAQQAAAVPQTPQTPAQAQTSNPIVVQMGGNNLPKGTAFTRYAIALAASRGNKMEAIEFAKQWKDSTPEVEMTLRASINKTAVAAGNTTDADWAAPLVYATNMASEFIELLRPATIIGRIQGLRRVPFNIRMPKTASGSSANWVGQGSPKPVSKMDFDTVTLGFNKIAGIVVLTEELVRFSSPAAEAVVRQDMIDCIAAFSDAQFIDPTVTASGAVRPASITNGITGTPSTGATVATIMTDVQGLFNRLITGNITLRAGVWVMHPRTALYLSMLRTAQDVYAFPGISMTGGTFYGLPVVVSASVPIDTGNDTYVVLMDASEVYLADDGQVSLDVSNQASLEMDTAPSGGAQALVSLWQNNMIGLRAERFITWKRRRDAAVAILEDVTY